MKNIILFIWQLPQNILGIIVVLFTKAKPRKAESIKFYFTNYAYFGVSLGRFIILGSCYESIDVKHESGHQKQSLYLGWLYLLVIGLPSFVGNIIYGIDYFIKLGQFIRGKSGIILYHGKNQPINSEKLQDRGDL